MGPHTSPRSQILQALSDAPECELDELVKLCPELQWHQIFLEVDQLSRIGALLLIPLGRGRYRLRMTKSEPATFPAEDAGPAVSATSRDRIQGEYDVNTFTLTCDRLFAWRRYACEDHHQEEQTACVICGYQKASQPWEAVVRWLEKEGFGVSKSEEGVIEIRCLPSHTENDMYRLIAGHGAWV